MTGAYSGICPEGASPPLNTPVAYALWK